jgi:2-(3-amino-3-carboxypropyl)histidine synthase
MIEMAKPEGNREQYDLGIDTVSRTIKEKGHNRVLLQFPEGLKSLAVRVKDAIEESTDADIIIYADTCYGACDLPHIRDMGIDLIVQFGHSEMGNVNCGIPVMFVEAHSTVDVIPVVERALPELGKTVGLITTAQHVHELDRVKKYLEERGVKTFIGHGSKRVPNEGQVLGCNLSSATAISQEVDCYLYIGSGNFHPIGVAMATDKPVICADPYVNEVRNVADLKDRLLRQRHGAITQAGKATHFGILVGTKPGQERLDLAFKMKQLTRKHGKNASVLLLNEFGPMKLKSFSFEAYVSTACPRIALDDHSMYDVPILTPLEFRIVLGETRWERRRYHCYLSSQVAIGRPE